MSFRDLPKIELHVHFDGACRLESLMDMCRKDGLSQYPYDNPEEFKKIVTLSEPQKSLVDFLKPFPEVAYILSTAENLHRHAVEFCEDQKKHNIIYSEVRYCPNLFTKRGLTADEATQNILSGLEEGQKKCGVKVRSILSFLKTNPEWSPEIVELAIKYKDRGVVGIDIAGDELSPINGHLSSFKRAYEAGLHITVHAGESGPASNVKDAIENLKAERIGHGYHVVDDDSVYKLAKDANVHFEVCLTSSIWTNSMSYELHSVKQFLKDNANFGLNTDDAAIMNGMDGLTNECEVAVSQFGLTKDDVIQTMFNAAKSCFLPENEKAPLLAQLAVLVAKYKKDIC